MVLYFPFCVHSLFSHLPWLFTTIILSKLLILLISCIESLKDKKLYFLVLYICSLSKSGIWFWIRKVYHYQCYEIYKWRFEVLTVRNAKNHWNKVEFDSRCLLYKYSNRIGDFLSFLPNCKKNIVMCLINRGYVVFYLGRARYFLLQWS